MKPRKTGKLIEYTLSILIFLLLFSCTGAADTAVSFYYWKSGFSPAEDEMQLFRNLNNSGKTGSGKLYIRFFDVIDSGGPVPEAVIRFNSAVPADISIIPCIYMENDVFKNDWDYRELAGEVNGLIDQLISRSAALEYDEVQIDCDWTMGTKDNYFSFLETFRDIAGTGISATIRLHQVKYAGKTGIPPVDRGILMCYNIGDISDPQTKNSIIDPEIVSGYMYGYDKYKLPLIPALPIFSQIVIFRYGRIAGIAGSAGLGEIEAERRFIHMGGKRFRVSENFYFGSIYLYKDDIIRLELSDTDAVKRSAKLLAENIKNTSGEIIFFHLDDDTTEIYNETFFKDIAAFFY